MYLTRVKGYWRKLKNLLVIGYFEWGLILHMIYKPHTLTLHHHPNKMLEE
jgi:hypothetical protein